MDDTSCATTMRVQVDTTLITSTQACILDGCPVLANLRVEKQQWTFYKWERPDSVMAYGGQAGGPAGWREGPTVEGTYNLANPVPEARFESLDRCEMP